MKAVIARAVIVDTPERLQQLEAVRPDLLSAANIQALELRSGDQFAVEIEFAETESPAAAVKP